MDRDADFLKALDSAKKEMAELLEKRSALDARITQIKATIDTLSALLTVQEPLFKTDWSEVGESIYKTMLATDDAFSEVRETGISDAIRHVLMTSPTPMSPTQVRDALEKGGLDLTAYANKLSVIHNTLKRSERQGELMTVRDAKGNVVAYTTRLVADPPAPIDLQ